VISPGFHPISAHIGLYRLVTRVRPGNFFTGQGESSLRPGSRREGEGAGREPRALPWAGIGAFPKMLSRWAEGPADSGLFGFGLRFGSVTGFSNLRLRRSLAPNQTSALPNRYLISVNAPGRAFGPRVQTGQGGATWDEACGAMLRAPLPARVKVGRGGSGGGSCGCGWKGAGVLTASGPPGGSRGKQGRGAGTAAGRRRHPRRRGRRRYVFGGGGDGAALGKESSRR